jgi:phosphoribosylformylglycinamidine cyclo-ligase
MQLKPMSHVPELDNIIGNELLKVHVSYGPLVQKLLKRFNGKDGVPPSHKSGSATRQPSRNVVKAFAHITGGGFVDNIPRVLPKSCDVAIAKAPGTCCRFSIIDRKSGVPDAELYQVFNMGIGMVAIVSAESADAVLKFIRAQKHQAWLIGEVVKGGGMARVI